MISFGIQPLAAKAVGWEGERFGAHNAILFNGIVMFLLAALALLRPGLTGWEPAGSG